MPNNMFRTKKIEFCYETLSCFHIIFFKKNDFFSNSKKNKKLFGTYYYVHEMKNKRKKFQVDKIKFEYIEF
jgi:hypothetical protein